MTTKKIKFYDLITIFCKKLNFLEKNLIFRKKISKALN